MRIFYIITVVLAVIFSTVLLLGCGEHSSPSEPVTIQGNAQESENTGTVEGVTWYTDTNPDKRLIKGVHITFSAGGQTYSTDSVPTAFYSIKLPSSSEPGIRYKIKATAEGCQPYEGEVFVVTGTSVLKDIVVVLTK
jgi:hypothetical protein